MRYGHNHDAMKHRALVSGPLVDGPAVRPRLPRTTTSRETSMSKFGRQPISDLMNELGWSGPKLADRIGEHRGHFKLARLGWVHPSDKLRDELPKIFNRPLEDLFTEESLARPYAPHHYWGDER